MGSEGVFGFLEVERLAGELLVYIQMWEVHYANLPAQKKGKNWMICEVYLSVALERYDLTYDVSPASSNRILSFVTLSSPSRNDSNDREICPS